jgi:uncharacterized repeat protein (TIGR01451 family)
LITKNVQKINNMFKKIVTNLPFHPTLLGDLGYYLRRVRQEQAIRRLGLVFVILAMFVQIFAFLSPVKSTIAYNTGDIVYGATSKEDIVKAFKNNKDPKGRTDVRAIFDYYGIGLDQIQNSKKTTISDSDNDKYINTSRSPVASGSSFVKVPGAIDGGIYEFPLKYWNKSEFPNGYPALTGISTYGFRFWILLKGCGNIVIERGSKHPRFEIDKKLISSQSVTQEDKIQYKIEFRNSGLIASENVRIVDVLDDNLKFDSFTSNIDLKKTQEGQKIIWEIKGQDNALKPSDRWHKIVVTAVVKKSTKDNTKICNQATIKGTKTKDASSGGPKDCVIVTTPTCPGTGLPIPPEGVEKCFIICQDGSKIPYNQTCPIPNLSCQSLKQVADISWNKRRFETKIIKQPGAQASSVNYFVNSNLVAKQSVTNDAATDYFTYEFPAEGTYKVKSEVIAANGSISVPSQNCEITVTTEKPVDPTPRIVTDKAVANETKNIADANNTTAQAGDILAYKLIVENTGDAVSKGFSMTGEYAESIADILEYADLIDKGGATYNESTGVLSWEEKVNIEPGQKIEKVFKVQVKDPIPATPISASNPLSNDFVMTNIYGREVTVKLDKPASKNVEIATTTLPNTGPGETMLVSVIFVTIIAFFYYRSRLLGQEIEIVRYEYSTGGL